jgi:serine/threonine protein kinase
LQAKVTGCLYHPNIIRVREVFKTKKSKKICIVTEWCDSRDLNKMIIERLKTKNYFTEDEVTDFFA